MSIAFSGIPGFRIISHPASRRADSLDRDFLGGRQRGDGVERGERVLAPARNAGRRAPLGLRRALRVLCLNSVDGSSTLRMLLGWYRFVCANGLAVGTTRAEWRGLELAERERIALKVWRGLAVPIERFVACADEEIAKAWGVMAAARFLHIATTGFDAEPAAPFEPGPPHAKTMIRTRRVPGCPGHSTSVYDASQILAWIAKDRRDPQEHLDRMLQIPELVQLLMGRR